MKTSSVLDTADFSSLSSVFFTKRMAEYLLFNQVKYKLWIRDEREILVWLVQTPACKAERIQTHLFQHLRPPPLSTVSNPNFTTSSNNNNCTMDRNNINRNLTNNRWKVRSALLRCNHLLNNVLHKHMLQRLHLLRRSNRQPVSSTSQNPSSVLCVRVIR